MVKGRERKGQVQCAQLDYGETHTHTHRQRPELLISAPPTAAKTSGKDPASMRHFSPSRHEASAERGWAKVTGLQREEVGNGVSLHAERPGWGL